MCFVVVKSRRGKKEDEQLGFVADFKDKAAMSVDVQSAEAARWRLLGYNGKWCVL